MSEEEFDPRKFFETLRRTASVRAGAVVFGEAQMAYYDTLKQHMSEDQAYNMLAHSTEAILKAVSNAAGPVTQSLLQGAAIWQKLEGQYSDKTVPGGN